MPDHTALKIGDRIRYTSVPAGDIEQRDREIAEGLEDAGWTAGTIERITRQRLTVTINRVDEYGHPWFDCTLIGDDGTVSEHTLAVVHDDGWILV